MDNDDIATVSPHMPLISLDLSSEILPRTLIMQLLTLGCPTDVGSTYILLSLFPEDMQRLFALHLADYEQLEEQLRIRLSTRFLAEVNHFWSTYQTVLQPTIRRLRTYVIHKELLNVPGVALVRNCNDYYSGPYIAVYLDPSRCNLQTSFLIPPTDYNGYPIVKIFQF